MVPHNFICWSSSSDVSRVLSCLPIKMHLCTVIHLIHPCLIALQSNVERSDDKYSPRVPLQLQIFSMACCDRFRFIHSQVPVAAQPHQNDRCCRLSEACRPKSSYSRDDGLNTDRPTSQNQSTFMAYHMGCSISSPEWCIESIDGWIDLSLVINVYRPLPLHNDILDQVVVRWSLRIRILSIEAQRVA